MLQSFAARKNSFNLDVMSVSDCESSPLGKLNELTEKILVSQIPQTSAPQVMPRVPSSWGLGALRPYVPNIASP